MQLILSPLRHLSPQTSSNTKPYSVNTVLPIFDFDKRWGSVHQLIAGCTGENPKLCELNSVLTLCSASSASCASLGIFRVVFSLLSTSLALFLMQLPRAQVEASVCRISGCERARGGLEQQQSKV